jgi:16S rRNA (adenine1518-N6/adenine1519-N6)-dimethyltransferase
VGTLTERLSHYAHRVIAIELDPELCRILEKIFGFQEKIRVLQEDALKVNFHSLAQDEGVEKIKVVANLPYYISSPMILHLLEQKEVLEVAVIMLQREVAERLIAFPGTKEYGILTIAVQYGAKVEWARSVSRSAFLPSPKVDSAVLKIIPLPNPPVEIIDEKLFWKIIRAAFQQRRKMLINALLQSRLLSKNREEISQLFLRAGIEPRRRGETLSLEEFARLANLVQEELVRRESLPT